MATKSILDQNEIDLLKQKIRSPKSPPTMGTPVWPDVLGRPLCRSLVAQLEKKLSAYSLWEEAQPVALGSWSRNELCPGSDVDMLFAGPETTVGQLVDELNQSHFKIRYRVPEDINDWTVGVEPFDILAILNAKAFTAETKRTLENQQRLILSRRKEMVGQLIKSIANERGERSRRYDSVANYLEPNIKYGRGGLRDIFQSLVMFELLPDNFQKASEIEVQLRLNQEFLLAIRQYLHLYGFSEILVSTEQKEISQVFGYTHLKDFMRQLQMGLSDMSFYADWTLERASSSDKRIFVINETPIEKLNDAVYSLVLDPSYLMQGRVNEELKKLPSAKRKVHRKSIGRLMNQFFDINQSEDFFTALFRSHLIDNLIPEVKRVRGLVQHDQYHRYTVDAHLLQTIRTLKRVHADPNVLGMLNETVGDLDEFDWKALLWGSLFHDIAKGRGGNHSKKGAMLVKRNFIDMGLSLRLTVEVTWLVENHLLLSTAAFRMNPQSPSLWKRLHEKGVKGQRLKRLAIFTAVDILATNPDAWTEWKERLLRDLVSTLETPQATNFMKLLSTAENKKIALSNEFIRGLDPAVIESVPLKFLLRDYKDLKRTKRDLKPLICQSLDGRTWVRFHQRKDEPGIFLNFTQLLYASGCSVLHASIQTYEKYGVYDWFKVRSRKNAKQLRKLFDVLALKETKTPEIQFDKVVLVSQDDDEAIISFRGKDKKGALIAAVKALSELGLVIRWAKVMTWGRQLDDIFSVKKPDNLNSIMKELKNRFEASPADEI